MRTYRPSDTEKQDQTNLLFFTLEPISAKIDFYELKPHMKWKKNMGS